MPITNDEIKEIKDAMRYWTTRWYYRFRSRGDNWYNSPERLEIPTWAESLENGRNYMVGPRWTLDWYERKYRYPLSGWLRKAAEWAWEHGDETLVVEGSRLTWEFSREGDHVVVALPYHGEGGEKHWIAKPPFRSRVLVNVD